MLIRCCLLLLSFLPLQLQAGACNCRETDSSFEMTTGGGQRYLLCGWEDKSMAPEVSPASLVMLSLRDCTGDSLIWSNEYDDVTPYRAVKDSEGIRFTQGLLLRLSDSGQQEFVALKQFDLIQNAAGATFDSNYVYEPPKIVGERLTHLLEPCRRIAQEIREGEHLDFPGDASDLEEVFLGAISNIRTARWLFTSLPKHFLLEGKIRQAYEDLALVYTYIDKHENFDAGESDN